MSPDKVWAALAKYDADLERLGYVVRQFDQDEYAARGVPRPAVLAHCRWMARKCLSAFKLEYETAWAEVSWPRVDVAPSNAVAAARAPLEKAMRWLCYIQGACHAYGLYSCDDLRDTSRGGEGEFKPAAEEHAARRYALADLPEPGVMAVGPSAVPAALRNPAPLLRTESDDPGLRERIRRIKLPHAPLTGLVSLDFTGVELKSAMPTEEEMARYAALEKEHLGDPAKGTGIYHPDAYARRKDRRAAAEAELDACFCLDQHSPPGATECAQCKALRAEIAAIDAVGPYTGPTVEQLLKTDTPD